MNAEQMKQENKQGACDCPHKENCHLTRQFLADEYKKQHGIKCDFIKYFERRKAEPKEIGIDYRGGMVSLSKLSEGESK